MVLFDAPPSAPACAAPLGSARDGASAAPPQAEVESLRHRNAALISALDLQRVGTILVDGTGLVQFVSRSAEGVVGCRREEACGRPWLELLPLTEADRVRLGQRHRAPDAPTMSRVVLADGTRRQVEIDVRPAGGRVGESLVFVRELARVAVDVASAEPPARSYGLLGDSAPMRVVYRQIEDLGQVASTVLLQGETGTGKELAARAIHQSSERRQKAYVAVNCAGLTESLLASQLFGHRRGAFTGAVADQVGLVESAHGGTLFLDEIGDLPVGVQMSLLRFLQEREIVRLGESRPRHVDVRIIAATHRDLASAVTAGTFREDLYYRIRVAQIDLPALRDRLDDLPMLVASFIAEVRHLTRKPVRDISDSAMAVLLQHRWPGNVRELRAAIESAVVSTRNAIIQVEDLPRHVRPAGDTGNEQLLGALHRAGGNRAAAARLLGISRATFYRRLDALKEAVQSVASDV